ncbi:MAG: GNAT family N-acetyltransferase [Tepidisphaeraceae bacterium]
MSAIHNREPATGLARVDLVDNWHRDWPKVLRAVEKQGERASLHVDPNGWLSARQNLLVAFVDDEPAAHVCFHVEPALREPMSKRACVEARLDSYGIDPKFCGHGIEHALRKAALDRAKALKCKQLHGFDLNEAWC